ncbi:MAG: GHMP kinase [Verrucomicrobiaceae bacterium]|nr:GHMP kinase [Verrucomicrobiaceae bacterium]
MIITQTPLRASFAGGGTDLPAFYEREEGAVVSTAIDLYVYLAAHRLFEPKIFLKYSRTEVVTRLDEVQHPLIRECMRICGCEGPIELTSFADIPSQGSGLGSSSSFAVGLINALHAFQGRTASAETCAALACEVEIGKLQEPIGRQDQYAAAYGGLNLLRFRAGGGVEVNKIPLGRDARQHVEQRMLMYYTGITRSASDILAEQSRNTQSQEDKFNLLRRMRDQAYTLAERLQCGEYHAIGEVMHEGWLMKRQLAQKISNPEIDTLYQAAIDSGATGGKLLGAGGGGFLLFYCEPEKQPALRQALSALREVPIHLENQGTRVIFYND